MGNYCVEHIYQVGVYKQGSDGKRTRYVFSTMEVPACRSRRLCGAVAWHAGQRKLRLALTWSVA